MTNQTLAVASDYAIWGSMIALAVALVAFSVHLAVTGASKERSERADAEHRELVTVGASSDRTVAGAAATSAVGDASSPTGEASRRWGVIGLQLTWLATLGVVSGTVLRGLSVSRPPLGNMYEFALMASSFALVIFSVWSLRRSRLWLGAFIVLPVLVILGTAKLGWYTEASQLMPALKNVWLVIHVTIATLSVGLFTIGFSLATAYLLKDRGEKKGEVKGWLAALPAAKTLERLTYSVHIFAFPLWTFAVISGSVWAEQAWGRYWGWDPKETWTFVIWVVYAAYLHARATTGWTTRQATWVAIAGFVCVILNFTAVNLLMTGLHSYSGVAT